MRRTPSDDDAQAEDSHTSHPPRRRSATPRQQADYYSDEHPEIPKVRRASLYLEQPKRPAVTPVKRIHNDLPVEDEEEGEQPSGPHETSKIMVAQRRRTSVYAPPPASPRRTRGRRKRQPLSWLEIVKQPQHRRMLILLSCACLVFVVLLPIGITLLHTMQPRPATSMESVMQPGSGQSATSNSTVVPAGPHELVITPSDTTHPAPPVYATSAYLLDADTGATLYASNPFMHLPMLSTTKLMTALLASEEGKLDQNITITPAMANDIGQLSADSALMGIKQGETYTLRDLLYGLFLVSGNDAAIVIADALAGNLQNFVAKMNQQAGQLGLNDTHYMNPHGLLATGQFSSAHDLAILGKTILDIPMIQQISGTRQYHIAQSASHAEHFLTNGDQFLWWYPGVNAGKTGWDAATDFIQVVSCIRNGHHLIGVVMHTNDWWTDMRDLMNWGFSNFTWVSPRDADAVSPIPYDADWNYFARDKKDNTIPLGSQGRYYIFTGYSISGSILTYFDQHGALGKFGYPVAEPAASGTTSTTQRFEHGSIQCSLTSKQCKTV